MTEPRLPGGRAVTEPGIRQVRSPGEAPGLAALSERIPELPAWSRGGWESEIGLSGARVWLAESLRGGEAAPVGLLAARRGPDGLEILMLGVAPEQRRRGLASRLMAQAWLEEGPCPVHLEVREGNAAARTFYRGQGFREVGRRLRYYPDGEAAVLLSRPLPSGKGR